MKLFKISTAFYTLALAALTLAGCKKDEATPAQVGTVSFGMDHIVGTSALVLNTGSYTNAVGQQFTVSKFNYIVSNFKLKKADGSEYAVPESYFLISEDAAGNAASSGTEFELKNIPVGDYTGMSFLVGVDAPRNLAGAQQGALATTNGMYWDWVQGYVFLKMEGTWQQTNGTNTALQYHIGGFQDPNNSLRTVVPAWPAGTTLLVRTDHQPEVHVKVNLLQLLNGATTTDNVSFAAMPTVHMPGAGAIKLATNLSGSASAATAGTTSMFRVDHIHAN
jgi:hypothetical protein